MARFQPWDQRYRETPVEQLPWFLPTLDASVAAALARLGLAKGRVLDIGTGPGTQALELAARGFDVVGTDLSPAAIASAVKRAATRDVKATFLVDDILHTGVTGTFDLALDRGCFHVLAPEDRTTYVRTVAGLLNPGGHLLLECFSDEQPGTEGPYRLAPDDIRAAFDSAFTVISIARTRFTGNVEPNPAALFCVLQKKP